jgi:hypothetical protein
MTATMTAKYDITVTGARKTREREKIDGAASMIPLRASSTSGKKLVEDTPAFLSAIS